MKNLRRGQDGRLRWHWDPAILGRMPSDEVSRMLTEKAERLPRSLPTLLVCGAASDVVDAEGIEAFRSHAPYAEIASVEEAGHMVAGDRNDAFNAIILDYLQRTLKR
jgi:pimeloyl-ACP methyl ester carboxylesterase